jgi:prepilin-type processing-associated H-X9-DG protein
VPNWLVFAAPAKNNGTSFGSSEGSTRLSDIADGSSNTLVFAEHYGYNCTNSGSPQVASGALWWDWFPTFIRPFARDLNPWPVGNSGYNNNRYMMADMFQVAPDPVSECVSSRAQSPHSGGMNVGVADGSVRFLAGGGTSRDAKNVKGVGGMSPMVWAELCDPRDANLISQDW